MGFFELYKWLIKTDKTRRIAMINIAADGGGTKLSVVAFDENLNILANVRGNGVNALFIGEDIVRKDMEDTIDKLFASVKKSVGTGKKIDNLYLTLAGNAEVFKEVIRTHAEIEKTVWMNEGELGLYAATYGRDGLLALAGTGSDCFWIEDGKTIDGIGGWGIYFGDEGSGFYIGREAILAAIKSHDGRGEKTVLEKLVFEQLGLKNSLWEVCSLHLLPTFRSDIASLTKAVEDACRENDEVALEIVKKSAEEVALAAVTLLHKNGQTEDSVFIYSIAGGAWKTSPVMIRRFCEIIGEKFPKAEFVMPEFEPVTGGIIMFAQENGISNFKEKLTEFRL